MSREDWLRARAGDPGQPTIGGSDLGIILGLSPYKTALQLWLERTGQVEEGPTDAVQQAGRFLEPGILRWYAAETGRRVYAGPELVDLFARADPLAVQILEHASVAYADDEGRLVLQSRRWPWLAGSVDAIAVDPELGAGIVDAKNTHFGELDEWRERSPPHYRAQVAGYTLITGLRWGGFAVLFGGRQLGWSDEPRDEALEGRALAAAQAFADRLVLGEPPGPDLARGDVDALRAMHGVTARTLAFPLTLVLDGERVTADAFDQAWCENMAALRSSRAGRAVLETTLRNLMGDAREIRLPSGVSYRRNERKVWRSER